MEDGEIRCAGCEAALDDQHIRAGTVDRQALLTNNSPLVSVIALFAVREKLLVSPDAAVAIA
jgi:hypothetical protein